MPQINITVLNVQQTTQPSKKQGASPYQMLEVAYKNNTFQSKVESKKIMPFGAQKATFDALAVAQPGESYDVEVVKNAGGFNEWVSVQKAAAGAVGASPVQASGMRNNAGTGAPRSSNFETPEERALRQVYIVRQSSLATAERLHSVGAKAPVKVDELINTAKKLEAYVFNRGMGSDSATGFDDIPDFPAELAQPEID